ncbi:uncharacterized protein GGS25DRAFT_523244 [Hypoxylon fragiforme]|uniref:uncharacterized protein n=1 Tax=Hypoxylon fragiforme TaxID=63214 RepID=UPI0020C5DDC9|nr:uncharacterized protein GGS25DRAFT_523244 [Hypoxylon fragiforme]KAI2607719.1 hypothetical protein GGS25DRAFT_523244 [Hypoxylon fragiforme]
MAIPDWCTPAPRSSLIGAFIFEALNILRLLELPEPRPSVLRLLVYCFNILYAFHLLSLVRVSWPSLDAPVLHRRAASVALWITTLALSVLSMVAALVASDGALAAAASVAVWALWATLAFRYARPPEHITGEEERVLYVFQRGLYVFPLLLGIGFAVSSWARGRVDTGFVKMCVWLAENCEVCGSEWLMKLLESDERYMGCRYRTAESTFWGSRTG